MTSASSRFRAQARGASMTMLRRIPSTLSGVRRSMCILGGSEHMCAMQTRASCPPPADMGYRPAESASGARADDQQGTAVATCRPARWAGPQENSDG
jgi:hypothetical protein